MKCCNCGQAHYASSKFCEKRPVAMAVLGKEKKTYQDAPLPTTNPWGVQGRVNVPGPPPTNPSGEAVGGAMEGVKECGVVSGGVAAAVLGKKVSGKKVTEKK